MHEDRMRKKCLKKKCLQPYHKMLKKSLIVNI